MAFIGINPMFLKLGFAVAWLVGSWLFGPKQKKNEIFDPGAEEMPRWNTALRGITVPILFGTNRVSSQVTWEHDYTVVRDDGNNGGGGKMGGSGGGKGGATQNGISYDYYWDFIFHIGMTHQVLGLSKVWLGSERISAEGVAAIAGGTGGTIIAGEDDEDTDEDERTKLKFEDSIFYSGSGAALGVIDADDAYDAWSEITADMGLGVRWPHTVYVGFKQLHLGQYPGVPQLSFEVGSGGGEITYNTAVLEDISNSGIARGAIGSTFLFRGDDGKRYAISAPNSLAGADGSLLYKEDPAGTWAYVDAYTNAEIRTLFENYGAVIPGGTFTYTAIAVLDPFDRLAITAYWTPGSNVNIYMAIAKINSSGVLEILGIHRQTPSGFNKAPSDQHAVFIANHRTEADPIVWMYEGFFAGNNPVVMAVFPSISTITGQNVEETVAISNYNVNTLESLFPGSDNFPDHDSYRSFSHFWWGLPKAVASGFGVGYSTLLFFYIGKSDMQAHINNIGAAQSAFVDSLTGTYPNGVVGYVDFGTLAYNLVAEQTIPSSITYNNAMGAGPFDDLALYDDDTTTHANAYGDYDPHPSVHKMSGANAGSYLVIFSQNLEDDDVNQLTVHNSWMRGKVLVWNPLALTFTTYAEVEFLPYLRTTDLGASLSTSDIEPLSTMIAWDEESNELYYLASVTGTATTQDDVLGKIGTLDLAAGNDLTPPEIIYQILTSTIYGIGITPAMVDQTSYEAAVAYCVAQEFKISCQIRREEPVLNVIDDILSCYGGFLVIANGIIYFKQLEYLDGAGVSVRTIDNDHLIADERGKPPVQITKGARQDTFNKVKVNYFDRGLEYAQNQVEEGDEVDQDLNGMRSREFPALFVMNEKMARTMAVRALWANLYSRDTYSFKLGWKDHDLAPGDCITLVDSYHNALQGGVTARIIEWKEQDRGQFQVTAKQEFEYIQAASASALRITSESVVNRLGGVPIIRDFTMYELPSEFQMGNVGMAYVSWATHKFARGANLWMSTDGTTYAKVQNQEPYQISGNLFGGLPLAYDGDFNENVEMLLSPRTAWTVSSPDYYFNQTLPSADQAGRAVGASLLWCGSEMMAYQGVTLVAQNRYRFAKLFRGWGGTNIHAHGSGDVLYKHGGGVFYQEYNEDKIGTKVSYKVQPYNLAGHYQEISSISAKSYTIVGRHYAPQIPPSLRLIWPDDQRGKTTHFVNSAIDIPISWERSAQKSGYGSKGHGAGGYGDFTADSQAFRVQVYGSGGLVVRSTSVASTYFNYDAAMNAADNGAWRGNVAFKVTPYNQYGDALKTSVVSLELW